MHSTSKWKHKFQEVTAQANKAGMCCGLVRKPPAYLEVCGCCEPASWGLWRVRHNVEILLDQTAINAQSLPGSTTVNNHWVSVSWMSNQSWECVHFNAVSREVYGFLFWHVIVANNRESHASIIKISWCFTRDKFCWSIKSVDGYLRLDIFNSPFETPHPPK